MFTNLLAFDAFLVLTALPWPRVLVAAVCLTGVSGFACMLASNVAWTFDFFNLALL